MRKNKAKATAMVDAFLAEPFTNDEVRMQQIVEQAKAESLRRAAEQPEKPKKKGLWRGAPAVCALVIILMVVPIVAVILNPVATSKANQLVRKATVWVNDTFKLGIELPVDESQESIDKEEQTLIFKTAEEAIAYLGKNILVLEEIDGNELISIEITDYSGVVFITQNYEYMGHQVKLVIEPILEWHIIAPPEGATEIVCNSGSLWMWTTDNMYRATGVIDEWAIDLHISIDAENVDRLISTITRLN